eukprot:TRINITY_DN5013_c0_g2_i1.p1 TRINITY_DN5013_c0_g2~~TRINITY_DN5013_c0_g2_i1.p1  ORF type:complete len:588 (+),score=119.10 TRINITY_DN5013_c0_g2_i1:70-1833(+)
MRALEANTLCFGTLFLVTIVRASAWNGENNGWKKSPNANGDLTARPIFMLRHAPGFVARLHEFVEEVSTPGRPGYGKYLTMAELKERLPVADGAAEAVLTLLAEHGVDKSKVSLSASGDMLQAEMSSATARNIFSADLFLYEHSSSQRRIVRSEGGYTLPPRIEEFVYLVGNLIEFPDVRRLIQVEAPVESTSFGSDCGWWCGGKTTPGVLSARYGFNSSESGFNSADTGMATAEFQGVYYDTSSLDYFQQKCGLKEKVQVDHQIGSNLEWHCLTGGVCIEALLDIEYAKAVSGGITLTNIFNDDYSLLDWAKQVDDLGDDGPSVHSISYGDDEVQQGDDAPSGMSGKEFMEATNVQFAKLAARGISVMVASGDQGVCGRSGCGKRFHPDFPASSPFVTAVGGTDFAVKSVIGEEEAWSSSGGGFSDEFETPTWQRQAVERYLASASNAGKLPADSYFNRTGRAYPDVAALGGERNPFCISAKILPFVEKLQGVAGTSASSPVFAAIVARLNAARLAKGMPRMGFMNPWIYKNPSVFHDVTKGVNNNEGSHGFAAMIGWDPATGMGTPFYDAMLHAALQPQTDELVV